MEEPQKINIAISKCLLGEKVRYDGQHKHDRYITGTMEKFFNWVGVCPEADCGMSIPREAMRLVGTPDNHRLMTINSKTDLTPQMLKWAKPKLAELAKVNLCGYIFKAKSPSSGMARIKIYNDKGNVAGYGSGIFAGMFMERFPLVPVIDEGRLHDPDLRENFIERVFVYSRWQKLVESGFDPANLQEFHANHKLLMMAHSPAKLKALGGFVAAINKRSKQQAYTEYFERVTEILKMIPTIKKHTNVLQHIMGYFKNDLSTFEKQELVNLIEHYREGYMPRIVPLTLLCHYTKKYDKAYLKGQYYLEPSPMELLLQNHS